jgi:type IV fimbrial biogenesis protein FimT
LSAVRKIRPDGFTLIELLIAIAIFSITMTYGVSSYRSWVLNSQIRNAAESISNGIMFARAEAVKCNVDVAFTLLDANSSWKVTNVNDCGDPAASGIPAGSTLESRPSSEGSKNVTVAVWANTVQLPSGTGTVTFGNFGTVIPNATTPTKFVLSSTVSAAGVTLRPLRVEVGAGGDSRVCDPDSAITAKSPPDPRRCYMP